ncbi:MAG: hypothetical protein ABI120_24635, partial [Gemmatimonadaceae bacterium]
YAESMPLDSSYNIDGTVRFSPLKWLTLSASHNERIFNEYADYASVDNTPRPTESNTRLEAGFYWKKKWFTAGVIQQSAFSQKPPTLLVQTVEPTPVAASTGITFGFHGPLYKAISLDLQGVSWNDKGTTHYRPPLSVRTDLSLTTNWLTRFPRGEFGINLHVIHEFRDPITFDYRIARDTSVTVRQVTSLPAQIYTTLLEIRIQRATIFYHFHNMSGQKYELVPGIVMPRQVQMYGVRWEFWN